ncbi:putative 2-deoxyglucose-6-phosphate phosphatase [Aspergillus pseudonomiae]|uniref:Putative 2-deoxyglucose-6-phosphate phosphatase n=1 Tax=Aspergillus pseudonomiae TaxID=1506151 RepID=A0A5N7CZJ3_9EURO|nr:putative 2-deoxyglucose-6-phosphate phosphatase [Aspergillus pseudonomiae]KAE8399575.1 putative 2-deoxyglucose-6-phosphate phosphatase [Aspergillus pseudonomiae]
MTINMPGVAATSTTHDFAGVLFDFDGTIIDSTEAIVENWRRIGEEIGIDHEVILQTSHGRRSIDVLKDLDPSRANWEYISAMESKIPSLCKNPAIEIPGARALLEALNNLYTPWAIVTSGTKALLNGWLNVLHLPRPQEITVAEDVRIGKPDPEGYYKARTRLLQHSGEDDIKDVLVVEDAPAGVKAGKLAGCSVLAVTTTHTVDQLKAAGADWVIPDHRFVEVRRKEGLQGAFTFTFNSIY